MNRIAILLVLLSVVSLATAQRMGPDGKYFGQESWTNLKKLLDKTDTQDWHLFMLLTNPTVAKQHDHYVRYVIRNFQYMAYVFTEAKKQMVSLEHEYHFVGLDNSKDVLRYLQQGLSSQENETLKQWIREKPVLLFHLTKLGRVKLMNNPDNQNHHLMLTFVERQTKLPVMKFARQMGSFNDLSVSTLNMIVVAICLGFFVLGTRKNSFHIRQVSTIPILLFPAGHVYNQIHGNDGGQVQWLGIPFSRGHNGQTLTESYFIFVLYVAFAVGMFFLVQALAVKSESDNNKTKVIGRKRIKTRAKVQCKGQTGNEKCRIDEDKIGWAFLSLGIVAFLMLHKSYSVKM